MLQNVHNEFRGRGGQHALNTIMQHAQQPGSIPHTKLKYKWAAPEMVEGALTPGSHPISVVNPFDTLCKFQLIVTFSSNSRALCTWKNRIFQCCVS